MINSNIIAQGIQSAVAPVFLLTAGAAMIGALATRLARIIDRARWIDERLLMGRVENVDAARWELKRLGLRGFVVNTAIAFLVFCALLIGATVVCLFLDNTVTNFNEGMVAWFFLGGILCFSIALVMFLIETLLATHTLRFSEHHQHRLLTIESPPKENNHKL
jgi:pilus assembly protein TadC